MRYKRVGDKRGVALPLALMAFVVLGALSAALLAVGSSEVQIAGNHLHGTQAFHVAEAGLEYAFNVLRITPTLVTTNPPGSLTTVPGIPADTPLGGFGSYTVQYRSAGANTNTVLVVSTGTSTTGGAQRVLRTSMSTSFISDDAIRTNGPLSISGNARTQGLCGSVHTNNNLNISGNPTVTNAVTATGTYTATGNPTVGAGSGGNKPGETVPVINPTDFLNAAKASLPANHLFQMKANGQVLDGAGTLLTTLSSGGSYNGWTYTSGTPARWSLSGDASYNGTYYFEGNVTVSGNPGSPTPWVTTLIATGEIVVSGNPTIQTDANCGTNCYAVKDTLFISGLDIKISGNPTAGSGLIAAHEQFKITGNPTITGFIIAEDASATDSTVISDSESGNPTITYDCGLNPPLQGPLQILSWGL